MLIYQSSILRKIFLAPTLNADPLKKEIHQYMNHHNYRGHLPSSWIFFISVHRLWCLLQGWLNYGPVPSFCCLRFGGAGSVSWVGLILLCIFHFITYGCCLSLMFSETTHIFLESVSVKYLKNWKKYYGIVKLFNQKGK